MSSNQQSLVLFFFYLRVRREIEREKMTVQYTQHKDGGSTLHTACLPRTHDKPKKKKDASLFSLFYLFFSLFFFPFIFHLPPSVGYGIGVCYFSVSLPLGSWVGDYPVLHLHLLSWVLAI